MNVIDHQQFNPQQREAIDSSDRLILCLAGAGAGKTKTLLARIERLIKDGVPPTSILALTFTNAAAFEMKERYKKLPGIDLSHGTPEFRTFHSFCYSLIIKDRNVRTRLGYTKIPEVCDDNTMKEIKTKVKLQLRCKLTDAELDNDIDLPRAKAEEKKLYQKALIKEIKNRNVITFDIMCYTVCELFEKNEECIEQYKQKYTYLFIDEMQDSDRRQFKFIASFPATTHCYCCADALQNIYQFRGCTNEYVKLLSSPKSGWKVIKLYKNYRSTTNICNFANKFSTYANDEYRIAMEGQRDGEDPEIIYGAHSTYDEPVDPVHLQLLIDKLSSSKNECAILCRTNKECNAVKSALSSAGIQFSARTKSTDTLNYLNSSLNNEYMLDWLATKLDPKEYGDYIRLAAQLDNPDLRWFLSVYGNHDKINKPAKKIIEIRNITSTSDSPESKFNKIVSLLRIKSKCTFLGDETSTNKEIVESIRDQIQEQQESQIYVGTIHSSKGLEYDTVYVMGVNDTMFQLGSEEMNNLYYVAITRAKNHLTIFRR